MWPKAFAQFVELAPHISRLLPMADRFFQTKTAGEDANRRAVEALHASTEDLRGDLGKVTAAHASVSEGIAELGGKFDAVAADARAARSAAEGIAGDARAARTAAESLDLRLTQLEGLQSRLSKLCIVLLVALVAVLVLLVFILIRVR